MAQPRSISPPPFAVVEQPSGAVYWFPALTYADDVLPFRTGPIRVRFTIKYEDYKRFGADIKIVPLLR